MLEYFNLQTPKAFGSRFVCQSFCHSVCLQLRFVRGRYKLDARKVQYGHSATILHCGTVLIVYFYIVQYLDYIVQELDSLMTNLPEVDFLAF